jgi:hypothetical protein
MEEHAHVTQTSLVSFPPFVARPLLLQPCHIVPLEIPTCTCSCNASSSCCGGGGVSSCGTVSQQSWVAVWTFAVDVVQAQGQDLPRSQGGSDFELLDDDVDPIPNFPTCTCGKEGVVVFSSYFNNEMVSPPTVVTQADGQMDGFFSPCKGMKCLVRGDGTCNDIDKEPCPSGPFELRW